MENLSLVVNFAGAKMGNMLFVTRPPETATLSVAPIRTPFTDMTAQVGHHDGNMRCFPFQLRWIDCCEAYGREMAKVKCKYLFQDFIECAKGWKQVRIQKSLKIC